MCQFDWGIKNGAAHRSLGSPDDRLRVVVAAPEDVVDDLVDVRGATVTPRFVGRIVRYQGHLTHPIGDRDRTQKVSLSRATGVRRERPLTPHRAPLTPAERSPVAAGAWSRHCHVIYVRTLIPAVSRICSSIITCTAIAGIAGAVK